MPSYTLRPVSDATPNSGTPSGVGFHWEHVDDNGAGSGYISLSLNEEEWFGLSTFAAGVPATDTVTGCRLRMTGEDPDANGDILSMSVRRSGVVTDLITVDFDSPGARETSVDVTPLPTLAQVDVMQIGSKCTNQTGAEVQLGYLVCEIDTTTSPANGPIIAGDEDATTM